MNNFILLHEVMAIIMCRYYFTPIVFKCRFIFIVTASPNNLDL